MQIVETGIVARGTPETARAILTFGHVIALADGSLLATCRAGTTKDSPDETIEFYCSQDGGRSWLAFGQPLGATRMTT